MPTPTEQARAWRLANPERRKLLNRKSNLKRYGVTLAQYDAMTALQNGLCAICKRKPEAKRGKNFSLEVDHNHVTGEVRGLLCGTCNTALHKLERDESWAEAAKAYLHKEQICQ